MINDVKYKIWRPSVDIRKYRLQNHWIEEHGFTQYTNSVLRIYTNNTITEVNWLKMVKMIYQWKKKCVDKFGCTHHSYQDLNISWWVEFENYIFVLFWLKFLAAMMMMMVFVGDNVVIFGVLNELFPVYFKSISIILNKGFANPFNCCSYSSLHISDDSLEL